jgi:hypothetical protein
VRLMLVQSLQQPMRDLLEISHDQYPNAKSSTTKLPTISFPSRKRSLQGVPEGNSGVDGGVDQVHLDSLGRSRIEEVLGGPQLIVSAGQLFAHSLHGAPVVIFCHL